MVDTDTNLKREGDLWKGSCPFAKTRHAINNIPKILRADKPS